MVEDGNSSILLGLVVFMISVLGMSFFAVYGWSDVGRVGEAIMVSVRGPADDKKESVNVAEKSGQGMVLGAQSIRPVEHVNYPVVHIAGGAGSVFEPATGIK